MDIKKYICSYEESISLIQDGINRYTRNELYSLINNAGVYNGIGMIVRNTFCHANYDDLGNVYLFDELNAKEITSYILNNSSLSFFASDTIVHIFIISMCTNILT